MFSIILKKQLSDIIFIPGLKTALTKTDILTELDKAKKIIVYDHNGLFIHSVTGLENKVNIFGLHFASLDIRQESTIYHNVLRAIFGEVYSKLSLSEKTKFPTNLNDTVKESN